MDGFRARRGGAFKAFLVVQGNPNVTISYAGPSSGSTTTGSGGSASFVLKKKGQYTVSSTDGSTVSVNVVKSSMTYTVTCLWSNTVTVRANPSATITLTNTADNTIKYTAVANSGTGIATVTVKHSGTYSVSSNNAATYAAEGNSGNFTVSNGTAYTKQCVRLNIPAALSVGNYSSNVLTGYWTRPSSNWTGCDLRYKQTGYPTNRNDGTRINKGAGSSIALTTTNVNGYSQSGLTTNATYYFRVFSYITINNVEYWATEYEGAAGVARNYVGTSGTLTSTGSFAVPTGWRQMSVFLVGGGGGGGGGNYRGGGGGGRVKTVSINVTPGQTFAYAIGAGGSAGGVGSSGGGGKTTTFGTYSAAGGGGSMWTQGATDVGSGWRSGGDGGSGGGARSVSTEGSSLQSDGGAGGSNGSRGGSNIYSRTDNLYLGGYGLDATTRAYGDSSGTLYAGGGGGGGHTASHVGGAGGSGGGGAGSSASSSAGTNGSANTGGGGGGGFASNTSGGKGGSGVILYKCTA